MTSKPCTFAASAPGEVALPAMHPHAWPFGAMRGTPCRSRVIGHGRCSVTQESLMKRQSSTPCRSLRLTPPASARASRNRFLRARAAAFLHSPASVVGCHRKSPIHTSSCFWRWRREPAHAALVRRWLRRSRLVQARMPARQPITREFEVLVTEPMF
jgi:hypothetical protein